MKQYLTAETKISSFLCMHACMCVSVRDLISPGLAPLVSFSSSNCRALQVLVLAAAVLLYCHRLPGCLHFFPRAPSHTHTHKVWIGALTAPNAISIIS